MTMKKIFAYFFIIMLTAFPAYAGAPEKSPGTGAAYLILIIISSFMVSRIKRPKP